MKSIDKAAQSKILIVEDEDIIAMDIDDRLEALGYDVAGIVHTGAGAIEMAGNSRPDLVLMDIQLEGEMDGITAAGQIRDSFDIPVIYLTSYSDKKTLDRAKVTQPFGYILKPFEERELHSTIEMALYRYKIESELKAARHRIKILQGVLPICSSCKDIRDDEGYWNQLEQYISEHSEADFSHSYCPKCSEKFFRRCKA